MSKTNETRDVPRMTDDVRSTCADCGAVFPVPPDGGGASGHAVTRVPLAAGRYVIDCPTEDKEPERRICYTCCARLEAATMAARGRAILYLCEEEWNAGDPYRGRLFSRNTMGGLRRYTYRLANWPGSAHFPLLSVRESHGYGFGRRYGIRTFRFIGPDGYVWAGRSAGDMQAARCRRTKEKAPCAQSVDTEALP